MADSADSADSVIEIANRANLANSHKWVPVAIANGECLFCGEPVVLPRRWCDFNCMKDWERSECGGTGNQL